MKISRSIKTLGILFTILMFSTTGKAQILLRDGAKIFEAERTVARLIDLEKLPAETVNKVSGLTAEEKKTAFALAQKRYIQLKRKLINDYVAGNYKPFSAAQAIDSLSGRIVSILKTDKSKEHLKKMAVQLKLGEERHTHYHDPAIRAPGDPCTNPDAEQCNFNGWDLYAGEVPYPSSAPFSYINVAPTIPGGNWAGSVTYNNGGSFADQHYVVTGGTDPQGGFPMVNPDGGSCSYMLGDYTNSGNGACSMSQTFLVSSANAIFTYSYAVVLQDPGTSHTINEKPFFRVRMYDQAGNSVACAENEAYGGDGQAGWTLVPNQYQYKPWTTVFIPLNGYIGQNVTIEFTIGDCAQGGHYGYGYVEASCDPITLLQGGQQPCAASVTLTAPPGAASYLWTPGGQTTPSITVTSSGTYGVTITPVTGSACSIFLDTTVTITLNPPSANFSSNAPQCVGTPINFTDLSNPNGSTFTTWLWDFGDGNSSGAQNPSHTYAAPGTYNVTLTVTTSAGCTATVTLPITVSSGTPPVVNPAGPFCQADPPFTVTANAPGGTWSATCGACINATTGVFDPALASLGANTVTYTIAGACGGSDTEIINIQNVTITNVANTNVSCFGACNGTITITATGATQYSIDNGVTFQASGSFAGLCPGTYNIRVESAGGCFDLGTANITEPTALTLPTSFTDETCFGACDGVAVVAPQGGTTPYNYAWSTGASGSPSISALCTGAYTVTVTDANGCNGQAVINISGPPGITITNIATTDELCPGDCQGSIAITAAGATQYSINGGTTFQGAASFGSLCAGPYNIVVKDANGCTANGNATILSPPAVTLTPGANSTICIGQSATVSASASGGTTPYTFIWDQGLPNGPSNSVNPVTTTTYNVFVQDGNGCPTPSQPITVTVNPPIAVVAQSNQSICPGQSATITAQASGGNGGPYTYVWDDGSGNQLNGATQTVTPSATTTYTVTASDNCGSPIATDLVTITVNPLPVVSFAADTLDGCTPVAVNFTNTTNPALSASCFWNFGDGSTSNNCSTAHTFVNPGCYTITLTVTSPAGCQATATVNNMICVYPYPDAEFTASPQPTTVMAPDIQFNNLSLGAVTYNWDFSGMGTSTAVNPAFTFPSDAPGTYPVCLTATSSHGCVDIICHDVIIGDYFTIYVPNAFTPEGDGTNDIFIPVIKGASEELYEFMIFNRWGELIFRTEALNKGWDGTHKGQKSKEDVYVWKIRLKDNETGEKKVFYGHVSLLR